MIDWSRWRVAGHGLTRHAAERMLEMGLTAWDVEEVLLRPEVTYEQAAKYGPGAEVRKLGKISVATGLDASGNRIVRTVLWNTQEQYTRRGKEQ